MQKFFQYIQDMITNKAVRKKLLFTLGMLAVYRLFVYIPVPFVDITTWASSTIQ